jgi:hypothetical protein
MRSGNRMLSMSAALCLCCALAQPASAASRLTVHVSASPDKLGAPTNIAASATVSAEGQSLPAPVRTVTVYLPAGLSIDTHGMRPCVATRLLAVGPGACPRTSRIGFGAGRGGLELAKQVIPGPFKLDLFLGPSEGGRLTLLIYASGSSPSLEQFVVTAREVAAGPPYGRAFTADLPLVPTLPGAPEGSIESVSLTFGAANAAYFQTLHGRRRLVHVRGIVLPKRCPRGGFPYKVVTMLADGSSPSSAGAIPCPRRS